MFKWFKRHEKIKIEGECLCCGRCCRNLILIDKGKPLTHISRFIQLKKKKPAFTRFHFSHKDDSDGFLYFSCELLNAENKCDDHSRRPAICRKYPNTRMLKFGGRLLPGCGFRLSGQADFKEVLSQEMEKEADPQKKHDWYLIE